MVFPPKTPPIVLYSGAFPTSLTEVAGGLAKRLFLIEAVNDSDTDGWVKITNSAGVPIWPTVPIPPRGMITREYPFRYTLGMKIQASSVNIYGQVEAYAA